MVLHLEEKKQAITHMQSHLHNATSLVIADYQGTSVAALSQLRNQAREANVKVQVVRNRLFKIAVADTEFSCLQSVCVGPMIVVMSYEEPGVGAKLFKSFAKEEEHFTLKAFAYGGVLYDASSIDKLASLPNRLEALTKVAAILQAPVGKFASTLNAVPLKLVHALIAVKDSKAA